MKISCLVVDDEPLAVNLLEQYIEQVPYLSLAGKCHSALEALSFLHRHKVDLIFLDINMPKLTGMELAESIPPHQKIIFTTAYTEYAVDSYERNAVDYLLKPITLDRFIRAVNKAVPYFRVNEEEQAVVVPTREEKYLFVKSGKAIIQLYFEQVCFIEGLKDYVSFHTTEGKHVVYKRMKDLESMLPPNFVRVHNSFIVNLNQVKKIEDHHVFIGTESIPVSEKYRESFYEGINRRIL